jgi:hypothetical protein
MNYRRRCQTAKSTTTPRSNHSPPLKSRNALAILMHVQNSVASVLEQAWRTTKKPPLDQTEVQSPGGYQSFFDSVVADVHSKVNAFGKASVI